jgi:ABC-2 type transport system ATP-binding protein
MLNISAVDVAALSVVRGGRPVLAEITFSVPAGQIVGLLGPSGCGKSTLIRAVVGAQRIESGDVRVLGEAAGSALTRRSVGYVTQASSVYPDLTVRQNLRYFASLSAADDEAVERALDDVGLRDRADALARDLAGGQRTRVSLAAALLADPDVYLLDEPTVGLDPVLRRDLWKLFARLAADGRTLLVSSHVMDEAGRCDRVLLMREGRIIADATPQELRRQTGQDDLEQAFLVLAEEVAA